MVIFLSVLGACMTGCFLQSSSSYLRPKQVRFESVRLHEFNVLQSAQKDNILCSRQLLITELCTKTEFADVVDLPYKQQQNEKLLICSM